MVRVMYRNTQSHSSKAVVQKFYPNIAKLANKSTMTDVHIWENQ